MKKAFDQTVRDIKREVNKKVLKVPSIEQKVLDATSNEPWGPHGSYLADIAQATRNYHEYQMIMAVIWKRINDTGKNWRHVYKALTVLEYLVAHGSERVIDEIREHAYQISTLSDFQYVDSSGRDQGSNVRKKSQSLVVLVNDKDRIQEVRQKAAANRDKYRNTSMGGMYRPGSYGDRYDEDRYGYRDENRNGYGREREWAHRDDDKYGKYGDPYSRDGDHYGREYEDRYSRDTYRDDDYRGRSQSIDDRQYGMRSRSSDRDRDRAYDDDGQYSSRASGARADDNPQDGSFSGRRLERKFSEQNLGAPPSYEEAVGDARSPAYSERDGETASAPKLSSPPPSVSPKQATSVHGTLAAAAPPVPAPVSPMTPAPTLAPTDKETEGFDEFDPRGPSAAATTSNGAEMDLLGSLSESFSSNALAIMPITSATAASEADASANSTSGPTFMATTSKPAISNQSFDDPFGDGPFKAVPSTESVPGQTQNVAPASFFHPSTPQSSEPPQPVATKVETGNNFEFGATFSGVSYSSSSASDAHLSSTSPHFSHQELSTSHQDTDILADILPPSGNLPPTGSQSAFHVSAGQPASQLGFTEQMSQPAPMTGFPSQVSQHISQTGFPAHSSQSVSLTGFPPQSSHSPSLTGFPTLAGQSAPQMGFPAQTGQPAGLPGFSAQTNSASQAGFPGHPGHPAQPSGNFYGSFHSQSGSPVSTQMTPQFPTGPAAQLNTANYLPQSGSAAPIASQMMQTPTGTVALNNGDALGNLLPQPAVSASAGALAIVPQPAKDKDKFETKSTVWVDTLSRGLVNLNISGPKINPLADIGIDFDAINRKEKRMEKPTAAPVTSNITMGKAMGSGSGMGRAGASALRPPPNTMINSGMGVGLGGPPPPGIGLGGYGGVNQHMGVGIGTNMPVNMGVGMQMGMGQGGPMQHPTGFPTGSNMPGGYNPMMGTGVYGQQPYGGGYR